MSVPEAVRLGAPAVLTCDFTLDGDALYSVKWYKGGREFFRFTPKETPPLKVFPMPGLTEHDVKKEESNATQVSLREVSGSMAGAYSCEVSADAPSFHTVVVTEHLQVVETPSGQPVIRGLRPRYKKGEIIEANCTSPGSRPPANLTLVLNGHQVGKEWTRQYREVDRQDNVVPTITLRAPVRHQLFPGGRLRLKCIASIYTIYWQTAEKSAELTGHHRHGARQELESQNEVLVGEEENQLPASREELYEQGTGKSSECRSRLNVSLLLLFIAKLTDL